MEITALLLLVSAWVALALVARRGEDRFTPEKVYELRERYGSR